MSPQNILLRGGGACFEQKYTPCPPTEAAQPQEQQGREKNNICVLTSTSLSKNCPNPGPFLEILAEHVEAVSV
jgi:hypothetical protein